MPMAKRVKERSPSVSRLDGAETHRLFRDSTHPHTGRKDGEES
jgi:hypothetical protein